MVLPIVLALLAAEPAAALNADPLGPARTGQLQCYDPDPARHTCKSLAGYSFGADGGITNQAQVLITAQGPLVMTTSTPVTMRDGAVCGPVRAEDIDQAQLAYAGQPLDEARAQQWKVQLKANLGEMIGAEICTRYLPDAAGYHTQVTINGQAAPPQASVRMIWVRPDEGWTVGP
jgi:hypothetical protein